MKDNKNSVINKVHINLLESKNINQNKNENPFFLTILNASVTQCCFFFIQGIINLCFLMSLRICKIIYYNTLFISIIFHYVIFHYVNI